MFGILNIKGIALDKQKLEEYIEKFASDNVLMQNSDKQTYPIPRMIKNFEFITKVYNILNENVRLKINIHPAGEWLLDNYYVIEENVKIIQKELTLNKYKNFVGIANGQYKGYARILDVVELNIQINNPTFQIEDCVGSINIQGKVTMNPFFQKSNNDSVYDYYFDESICYQ